MRNTREDAPLSRAFAKQPADEEFMRSLNDALAPFEEQSYTRCDEAHACIYVCGPPRSGTTLLTQLLATHCDIQATNNLVAAFWRAPCVGLRLSAKLLGKEFRSSFRSVYGRTHEIGEPHEFGYFWAGLLGYRSMDEPSPADIAKVDCHRVHRVITNMQRAAGRALVFKAFMAAYYAERFVEVLPRSLFVLVRRPPIENCYSVLLGRKEYAGSEAAWFSIRPAACRGLEAEEPLRQVAMQVHFVNAALERILENLPKRNAMTVDYADLYASPLVVLERIARQARVLGTELAVRGDPSTALAPHRRSMPSDVEQAFRKYLAELSRAK